MRLRILSWCCCRVLQVERCCRPRLRDALCRVPARVAVAGRDSELQGAVKAAAGCCCRPRLRVPRVDVAGVSRRAGAGSRRRSLPAVFPERFLLGIVSCRRSHLRGGALSKPTKTPARECQCCNIISADVGKRFAGALCCENHFGRSAGWRGTCLCIGMGYVGIVVPGVWWLWAKIKTNQHTNMKTANKKTQDKDIAPSGPVADAFFP